LKAWPHGATGPRPVAMRVLVLPGMDGGAELSEEFRARMARWYAVDSVEYGAGGAPVETVAAALGGSEATVVVAESFSGAVALRALQRPEARRGVVGLVLAFSFVVSPTAGWMRPFARDFVFRRPPPEWAIRASMTGREGTPLWFVERSRVLAAPSSRSECAGCGGSTCGTSSRRWSCRCSRCGRLGTAWSGPRVRQKPTG